MHIQSDIIFLLFKFGTFHRNVLKNRSYRINCISKNRTRYQSHYNHIYFFVRRLRGDIPVPYCNHRNYRKIQSIDIPFQPIIFQNMRIFKPSIVAVIVL